jgi:hypothetical protein
MSEPTERRTFRLEEIAIDDDGELTLPNDLRAEYRHLLDTVGAPASTATAYRITIVEPDGRESPEAGTALHLWDRGNVEHLDYVGVDRVGLAWNSYADWGDVNGDDLDAVVDEWLNDPEAWEARN